MNEIKQTDRDPWSLPYVVISYYTKYSPYEGEIQNLVQSLQRFNLPYHIYCEPSRGSWIKNVQINEELILRAMGQYPGKAIVSLDADAVVQRYPVLFETLDCEFGAHYHIWTKGNRKELFCSTMYFKNCDSTKLFLQDCLLRYKQVPETRQQPNMMAVFEGRWGSTVWRNLLKFTNLPPQYCKIFDLMSEIKFPVIEQFQASRRFKNKV